MINKFRIIFQDTSPTKKEASLKNRLFDSPSKPTTSCEVGDMTDKSRLSPHDISVKRQDSYVLQVSPLMRHNRKSKNAQNITEQSKKNNKTHKNNISGKPSSLLERRKNILDCLNENSPDFVHVSTFCDIESAEEFLRFLRDSKTVAIDIYISTDLSISITYQRLINFKQDFMVLDLKRTDFMFFLKPF